jgi:hypothetical protein
MRILARAVCAGLLLFLPTKTVVAASGPQTVEGPGAVAISEELPGKWVFRSFPGFLPLYVFDADRSGKSACDAVCSAVWPILRADDGDRPLGQWTIISRDDGRRQWAYKNHPVYTFYQDTTNNPMGVGMEENWYYEDPTGKIKSPASKVSAKGSGGKAAWRLLEP